MKEKELGYHPVNIKALGILRQQFPNHPVWENELIKRAVEFLNQAAEDSEVLYQTGKGAMLPGIQTAYGLWAFDCGTRSDISECVSADFERFYSHESEMFTRRAKDKNLQAAAVSNLCSIPDVQLERN